MKVKGATNTEIEEDEKMLTINEQVNKEILKAKKILNKALELLTAEQAYNNKSDIFHNSTVYDVNRIITAIEKLND